MEMDNSMVYSDSLKNFKEYITKQFGGINDYDNNVFNYIKNDGSVDLLDLNNPNNLSNFNNNITEANIMRSFILNKTVKYLIRDDKINTDTYKCKHAFKLNIPVIHINYLYELEKRSTQLQDYLIFNKQQELNFNNGLISSNKESIKS